MKAKDSINWVVINSVMMVLWLVEVAFKSYTIFYVDVLSAKEIFLLCFFLLVFILLITCYFSRKKFILYSIIFFMLGLYVYFCGAYILGYAVTGTSLFFFWRQKLVKRKIFVCLIALVNVYSFLIVGIICKENKPKILFEMIVFLLLVILCFLVFYPQLKKDAYSPAKRFDAKSCGLTDGQIEILRSVLSGEKYTSIANRLGRTEITVKKQVAAICKKLEVSDRTELLVKYAGCTIS